MNRTKPWPLRSGLLLCLVLEAMRYAVFECYGCHAPVIRFNSVDDGQEKIADGRWVYNTKEALVVNLHEEIPLDYDLQCHLIAVCEEYGVPQSIALGVIQAESSFTADASNGTCFGYRSKRRIKAK